MDDAFIVENEDAWTNGLDIQWVLGGRDSIICHQ